MAKSKTSVTAPTAKRKPSKRIYWSGVYFESLREMHLSNDSESFFDWYGFRKRYDVFRRGEIDTEKTQIGLDVFKKEIINAKIRVWILDPHFDDIAIKYLLEGFSRSNALSIRIISTDADVQRTYIHQLRKKREIGVTSGMRIPSEEVEWIAIPQYKYEFLHDRFAVLDDELWHFGSTVGGTHSKMNAATRGWDANATNAIQFFERFWSDLMKKEFKRS